MIEDKINKVLDIASKIAKPFEGLYKVINDKVYAYHDPVGYPTIGYGHLLSKEKYKDLSEYEVLTIPQAEELLKQDMKYAVLQAIKASPILAKEENIKRWASISDFIFNCGIGNYKISTLKKKIDTEDWEESVHQIKRWNKSSGRVLRGLVLRRDAESKLLAHEYREV